MQVESCNLFPMAPVPSSAVTTLPSLVNPPYPPSLLTPRCISRTPILSPISVTVSLPPSKPIQRQGNLICSLVRKTLTEFNIWFPFIIRARIYASPRMRTYVCTRRYRLIERDALEAHRHIRFPAEIYLDVKREKREAGKKWRLNEEIVKTSWRYNLVIKFFFLKEKTARI